ncbi:hypothetical protein IJM86_03280 [bacterium]|nr:hypothetical protein [bacterium]
MKNVKKGKEKGKVFYEIKLPMNTSYARTYKVFSDNQEYQIDGQSKEIVEGKM